MFLKKELLKNFTKFKGKHLCWSLFFNKDPGLRPATLLRKRLQQRFSCEFCEVFKNTFLQNTSRRLLLFLIYLTVPFCKEVLYICSNLLLLEKSTKTHNFGIFLFCKYILYSILRMHFTLFIKT